ncbi:hypothetical protein E3P77_01436 [Wallemia ichthyophaga]|nr:hypothetical protein E3P77_01436 [Wallemia ichthyophaga]
MSGPQQATFGGKDPKAQNEVEKQAQDIQRQQETNKGGAAGREGVASTNPADYDSRGGAGGGSMNVCTQIIPANAPFFEPFTFSAPTPPPTPSSLFRFEDLLISTSANKSSAYVNISLFVISGLASNNHHLHIMSLPNVFFITGTSTGFGRELVLQLNARKEKVIATARNTDKIKDFEQLEHVSIMKLDLNSNEEEIISVVRDALKIHGHVTHLVNNAAYSVAGCVEEVPLAQSKKQFDANYWGTIALTNAFLPHFRGRTSGEKFIATISSLVGITTMPFVSYYCASKFAIEASFEALKLETAHLGIKVLLIEPGYFRTSFLQEGSNIQPPQNPISDYAPISGAMERVFKQQNGAQLGDPAVGSERIIELLTNTGLVKQISNGEIPTRVALGSDSYEGIVKKGQDLIDNANKWKEFSLSTDFKN